jgi:acetyl esterase/lipase
MSSIPKGEGNMIYRVAVERDLVYARPNGSPLALDIYRPAECPDAPVVVYFHGGGWAVGDKADNVARLSRLASHGVVVVSANYRFVPQHVFPAQIHDAKAVVRWVRGNADVGLTTKRIGAWGASAGAYLALMLGLTKGDSDLEGDVGDHCEEDSGVDAVVSWFGGTDFRSTMRRSELEARIFGEDYAARLLGLSGDEADTDPSAVARLVWQASPLAWVSRDCPPMLIAHGTHDRVVSTYEAEALHRALIAADVPADYISLGGAGHEDARFDEDSHLAMTAAWLRSRLAGDPISTS